MYLFLNDEYPLDVLWNVEICNILCDRNKSSLSVMMGTFMKGVEQEDLDLRLTPLYE